MKWSYFFIGIGLGIILTSIYIIEFLFFNSFFFSFLITFAVILNFAHIFTHIFNWELDTKKVLSIYFILSITFIIIEMLLTGTFLWSFSLTVMSLFFVGHYLTKGFNTLFKQFHIREVYRSLLSFYLAFVYFFLLSILFFQTLNETTLFIEFSYIFYISLICMILLTINSLIRIVAVVSHRRKYEIFPINRIEYAALHYLNKEKKKKLDFIELKNKINGIFNIFTKNMYFNENTAKSSIYYLCALGYADIEDNIVCLNEFGEKQGKIWNETLKSQMTNFTRILNRKSVLIRSFLGLFLLSLLKIIIGFFNSEAVFAEGFENFLDCIAVILIAIGIKFHKEKIANVIIIGLMTFTGVSIVINSIQSLIFGPHPISNAIYIVIIAIISVFLNTYLRTLKNFVGKKNRNSSLIASAIDSKVNIILSISIIVGALSSSLGTALGITLLYYFDPVIAIFVCVLIFKEVIEIIREFITSKEEEIEFEKFQMKFEKNFSEYIIKWILSVYCDNPSLKLTPELLSQYFQKSLNKGAEVYTEFAYFGLYLFKEKGIASVIEDLLKEEYLSISKDNTLNLTEKGAYFHEYVYSKEILKDLKDPFDFFFEQQLGFDSIKLRKIEILAKFQKSE
ncbi:MAG: cation transporter [Candidatus Lokiarchaeia archaeon]|nr:cation transporter [Candidatus Lokiarchaeia archaeon]